MRILMLSHGYHPTVSGVTHVVRKQAKALSVQGHEVAVVTASDIGRPYVGNDNGVVLIRIRSTRNPYWSEGPLPWISRRGLTKIINEFQPDLIHSHENAFLSIQLARIRGAISQPMVASCYSFPEYGAHYVPHTLGFAGWLCKVLWRYLIWNLNQYDHVICATQIHLAFLLKHGFLRESTIISNGVNTSRYSPQNGQLTDINKRYNLPPRPRILFVGRLARDKNLDILIESMIATRARCPAHLLIVGRGDDRKRLEDVVKRHRLEECVHFLGFVPDADLPTLYRLVDLFAMVSVCETQNIPTLQALATGLPAVVSKAGALPELVTHGVNGYLLPPGDPQVVSQAALKILTNPQLAYRFGLVSLEVGRAHSESKSFQELESLYEGLLKIEEHQIRQQHSLA
jgi:1,2-diacylglycerol 3-alpha-glucosyltransferase